ncbi:MAG: DUF2791 family P-loop domain-containing protein [Limnochordaceae bacterium]|nr:DUF2791 family P-loop domain-containing protein [Limnochordaceae bacterium]
MTGSTAASVGMGLGADVTGALHAPSSRQHQQQRIIENLRSGVPSPSVALSFPMGREDILNRIQAKLNGLGKEEGEPERESSATASGGQLFQANYGDGKTHLLHAIWNLARTQNCVVSLVSLSKEAQLDKPDRLYARIAANTFLPDGSQPGLERLLEWFRPGRPQTEDLLAWAERYLHPKVAAVVRNRIEGPNTGEQEVYKLDQDLHGILLTMQDLKAIHRLNFGSALRVSPSFKVKRDMPDYFRLVSRMIRSAGYQGWVILLDEVELIGRLGRGSRAASYAMLAWLLGEAASAPGAGPGAGALTATYTVGVVASNFFSEVLDGRGDAEQASAWLQDRQRPVEAELAEKAIARLLAAEALPSLTRSQLLKVMDQILAAHEGAYNWQAGVTPEELLQRVLETAPEEDVKLRTRIRTAIQWLDLKMQYGAAPRLAVHDLTEEPYDEEPHDEPDSDPDEKRPPHAGADW